MNFLAILEEFHPDMFLYNLRYMGVGMLCILIVMGVIIAVTALLEKISAALERRKAKAAQEEESHESESV